MTTVTSVAVQRSGPAIRAVLAERGAPGELECFEGEMRAALTAAVADLDLAGVEEVLSRWHSLAAMAANPLTDDERAQVAQAQAGDLTGLRARDERGGWITL
ncbi:MAG: DUF6247 family protein [Pseudonocardia sp.]